MRLFSCIAFALFLAAPLTAYSAEPESPDALIGQTDAVRAAIQERLSAKFTNASEARKSEQGALVEYYSIAENRLLWVDDHGLNDRAKSVMEEIGKADEYGLRPADYPLPKAGRRTPTSNGSPMPRSRSVSPCSVTPATRAAAASILRESAPISIRISSCPIRSR